MISLNLLTMREENRSYNLLPEFFLGHHTVPAVPRAKQIKSFIIWAASARGWPSFGHNFRSALQERTTRVSRLKYEHRAARIHGVGLNQSSRIIVRYIIKGTLKASSGVSRKIVGAT